MSNFSFFKAVTLLRELGEAGGMPPPPPGGAPGGDMPPPGGGGMPPPPGGGGGGGGMPPMGGEDPMGGGAGGGGEPLDIKTLPAADVWKLLEKLVKDQKYDKFFDEINIVKREAPTVHSKQQQEKKSTLQR